jgi:hypothetical protein
MFVEIRRCVYGHELEGYKHANERGDLEMVGGSHEEREGILGSYGAWRSSLLSPAHFLNGCLRTVHSSRVAAGLLAEPFDKK